MRLIPSDPDVETIVNRIRNGDLDLQPNFQRGEVWSQAKKQKLIDSVLRTWHVPPIHVIQGEAGASDEVLDGQQRLTAVRDFLENKFRVNGHAEPMDPAIAELHGLFFTELPDAWKRRVKQFPIRVFNIVDYKPSEPSELFYRLNQPTALTAAEQRNSFFGRPREQIKELADLMIKLKLDEGFLGFSNSRMAYDDTLSRVCVALEKGLSTKIGAVSLADRYRSGEPFGDAAFHYCREAVGLLASVREALDQTFSLSKASLFSWLIFFCRAPVVASSVTSSSWSAFFDKFENGRSLYSLGLDDQSDHGSIRSDLFAIYNDRVKARVADVSSVLLRDVSLWGTFACQDGIDTEGLNGPVRRLRIYLLETAVHGARTTERTLQDFIADSQEQWEQIR